jgi:hypothetical protein
VSAQKEQESLMVGCNAFLAKPFRIESLLERIHQYVNLEWIYYDAEQRQAPLSLASEPQAVENGLIVPPPWSELTELHQIAMVGQITKLRRTLDAIEATDARYGPFVAHLRQLAKEFHIEAIQDYIEHYLHESDQV